MKEIVFASLIGAIIIYQAFSQSSPESLDEQTRIQVEALGRLKGVDLESRPALKNAVQKVLAKVHGTPVFVELVRDFKVKGEAARLLEYALAHPADSTGVEAFRLAAAEGGVQFRSLLGSTNAASAVILAGNSGDPQFTRPLKEFLVAESTLPELRKETVRALAKTEAGAGLLLDLAQQNELPQDTLFTARSALHLAPWPGIKEAAIEALPLPQGKNSEALPPVAILAKRAGNSKRGEEIFFSQAAACSSCHQVKGKGIDFGPNLSEIGSKLGKEALYEAVLDPSSGISFGYEGWNLELKNGDELFGIISSEAEDSLLLKSQDGIVRSLKNSDIAGRRKMAVSIMPAGLQLNMSTDDLVDLVEYLSTLRKQP